MPSSNSSVSRAPTKSWINGVRHGVIEMRYGIYPQHSGELLVPAQTFSATQVDSQQSNAPAPLGPIPGKLVHVTSPDIPLKVKPSRKTTRALHGCPLAA